MTDYYFIRVNGKSAHCYPGVPGDYMPGEPPDNRGTHFNYAAKCLADGFIRIGWPNSGALNDDMFNTPPNPPLPRCYYNFTKNLSAHIQGYLQKFQKIQPGSVILMPDPDRPGALYLGLVADDDTYAYRYNPPADPFECAHRHRVDWLPGGPLRAAELGISTKGGIWLRAFAQVRAPKVIRKLERVIVK